MIEFPMAIEPAQPWPGFRELIVCEATITFVSRTSDVAATVGARLPLVATRYRTVEPFAQSSCNIWTDASRLLPWTAGDNKDGSNQ
jgi:hypothetical protein